MGESQSRSVMLHHQDQNLDLGHDGTRNGSSLQNKDNNFNFLPGEVDRSFTGKRGRGDENRNQVRPRNLTLGRDTSSSASSTFHSGILSPRSRLPCWSPLEPLPEIESGDDGYGRVPPDGAEEQRMEEEEGREEGMEERKEQQRKEGDIDVDDEWGDSDLDSEFSCRSGGSESGGEAVGGWGRVGVGEPKSKQEEGELTRTRRDAATTPRSFGHKSLTGSDLDNLQEQRNHDDQSSDSEGELPELMDAVWTLRDRERFKAQEMEKHQVQLTMYRRLALIRWVRTLQNRIQEQQNRLQSSFDIILTHRKELLRMGAGAVSQS
uniref:Chromosome 1 open reading frame 216 n=1 Tax=Iconisemion striatum TaxID=60296 RepID=A0A1A7XQ91_9TELE